MRNAKLPLFFVLAVVCFLVVVGLGLVLFTDWSRPGGPGGPEPVAQGPATPTGSSITALTAPPLPDDSDPWAATPTTSKTPSTTSPFIEPSTSRPSPARTTAPSPPGTPMTVSYSITGSGTATIVTYWDADRSIASEHNVALPWSRTVTLVGQSHIRLSVQTDSGGARCTIAVDGQVVSEQSGDYFASCETDLRPAVHDG